MLEACSAMNFILAYSLFVFILATVDEGIISDRRIRIFSRRKKMAQFLLFSQERSWLGQSAQPTVVVLAA